MWSNDGSLGAQPPGSVDEISLVSSVPGAPANSPTGLVLTPFTGSINGSFTAAAGAPDGYLVVRYPTGATPVNPVNGTSYTPGTSLGTGKVVSSGALTTFTATGLTPSTTYDFYVYSFTNSVCAGLYYKTTSPLFGTQSTLACAGLSGTYAIGPTGAYPSLTAALAAAAGGLSGPVIFELQATYLSAVETFPVTFPVNGCVGLVNTITIRPAAGAVGLSITSANATGTVLIDGGSYITFDGRAGGAGPSQLTISNTTTTGYAIQLINSARFNTIKYCTVAGVNTSTTSGVIVFSTAVGLTDGNSSNTIDNCDIRDGATTPTNLIYCSGTNTGFDLQNNSNIISNCTLHDWFNASSTTSGAAINIVAGASNWTITANSFYQTASRVFTMTTATDQGAVFIASTANNSANFTITNNFIGGTAPLAGGTPLTWSGTGTTGTPTPRMMRVSTAAAAFNNITGNVFANMAFVSASASTTYGLLSVLNGNTNISGNTFGSQTATGNITSVMSGTSTAAVFLPIGVGSGATVSQYNITNNNIGGITLSTTSTGAYGFRAIFSSAPVGSQTTISNNFIGGTVANSLQQLTGSATAQVGNFNGIMVLTATIGNVITNNTIRNMTVNTPTFAGPYVAGINVQASGGGHTITGNTIFNLTTNATNVNINNIASVVGITMTGQVIGGGNISSNTIYNLTNTNTTVAGWINGMYFATALAPQPNTLISKNFIHSINLNSATGGMVGIFFPNTGNAMITNNMIRLGVDASGASITTPLQINGIYKPSTGFTGVYYNTVYIGGTGVTGGAVNTYAYRRSANILAGTDSVLNNIFWNARSNGAGTGKHYAITLNSTTAILENNNDLFANGTGGFVGNINLVTDYATLPLWRAATSLDFASVSADPQLLTPNGTSATVDLHINAANPTPIEQAGLNIPGLTDDFDGQSRAALTPVDIGADAGNFILNDLSGPFISYSALSATCATGDRTLTAVTITDATGVPTSGILMPRIYYRKNAGGYFSQPGTLTSGTATNGQWSFTIVAADMGGLVATDVVSYYIIAQDIVATPNISSNPGGVVATDVNIIITPPPTTNSYTILSTSLSGTYTVGAAGAYTTLTAAVAAYNTSCLTGPVIFSLIDASYPSETYPITINANSNASVVNTLTIRPAAGNPAVISGSNANALIKWNGADWVTIDGINSGGSSLRITNTNAAGLTVLWIASASVSDGASNNAIKNCTVAGISSTGSVGCIIGGSGTTLGNPGEAPNNNNTIQGNTLTTAQNGVYISGYPATYDQNWVIDQNTIGSASIVADKMGFRGISVQNVNNTSISTNIVNGVVTATTATSTGITTFNGVTNCNIFNNKVSDVKNTNATGFGANGISIQGTIPNANINIYNNFVSDVAGNGFAGTAIGDNGYGFIVTGGSGYSLYYNTVVLNTNQVSATGLPSAMNVTSGVSISNALNIRNNIFANFQTVGTQRYSVFSGAPATVFSDINYNDYHFAGPNLGNIGGTLRANLAAWQTGTGKDANSISAIPVFVSATDFHLSNATGANWCLDGKGQTIATYTTDIDLQARGTPPDIGADEFTATDNSAATPSSQTICSGSTITTIVLSGVASSFSWTRNNAGTVTGIAASGTGNISGTLTNTTNAPITVTFTITPLNAAGCAFAPPFTATVLVNPTPDVVATPSSQTICSGATITTIALSGNVAGTVFNWTRDNTGTVTGIAASGAGNISGSLTNTTNAPVTVTFTITPTANSCPGAAITATVLVNPTPNAVATPSSQTICSGATITTIVLSGNVAGTVFNWTRDNTGPVTGIAARGCGKKRGTLSKRTNCSVTVTFTITPTANSCPGAAITATVLVNPTPNAVATPSAQTTCSGAAITTIVLSGNVAGTVFNWTRDNTGPVTGIASSGSGNISGSLTNSTNAPVTVTFTITPTANSCPGASITATVTVNPTATINAVSNQSVCHNQSTTAINFTSPTTGGTIVYNWTNSDPTIGLAASGTGDIAAFVGNNTGLVDKVATITVTPSYTNGITCTGTPLIFTITIKPLPTISGSLTQPTTCVSADGAITLTLTGPAGPYTFAWTGSGVNPTSQNQTGLTVGLYNVTVTAANGCVNTASFTLLGPGGCNVCPTMGAISTNPTPAACIGSPTTITVTGLTNMGLTYGITFKYASTSTLITDPYTQGTVIATVPNGGLTGGGTTASTVFNFPTAGVFQVYAILTPVPLDPVCRPFVMTTITIVDLPISYLVATPGGTSNANGCPAYASWSSYRNIDAANGGGAITNYRMLINVNTQALISANKMRPDGGDIRFLDGSCNALPFRIESGLNTTSTNIWITVPSVAATSTTTIKMLYGNPAAVFAQPNAATNVFGAGLVTLYTFTEGSGTVLNDRVGTTNLNLTGAATWAGGFRPGVSSITGFTGGGRVFANSNGPALGSGSFTVIDFVNATSPNGSTQGMVGNYNNDGTSGWVLKLQGGAGQQMLLVNNAGNWCQSSLGSIAASQWQMVGAKRNTGVTNTLYVNGLNVGTSCAGDARNLDNGSGPFELGRSYNNSYALSGNVSLVAIYNTLKSDAEILDLTLGINPAVQPAIAIGPELSGSGTSIFLGISVNIVLGVSRVGVKCQLD